MNNYGRTKELGDYPLLPLLPLLNYHDHAVLAVGSVESRRCAAEDATLPKVSVQFELAPFAALDQLALIASQNYNLGGAGDWFGEFRGGLYGFYARLYGVQQHYFDVHAWLPRVRVPTETEYHLASILFQMDSALECLTFALNALGWVVLPTGFRDVTDTKELKRIGPFDILGAPSKTRPLAPLQGYSQIFPTIQGVWQSESQLIARVRELHDVSKHRQTIFVGGMARMDPPDGFYEALGLRKDAASRASFWPMAEIILCNDPKLPAASRTRHAVPDQELLEDLVPSFAALIRTSGATALEDAQANIPLKDTRLRG
ncbi:MAG: hypothetical protein IH989_04495 [Planctomycetes bacterium]|nr:hypothetical protein [Planctomycetota bacterium]